MIDYIFITEIEQININIMKCPDFGWDRVNFFFVAGTMLCFGFSVRMRLITC